MVYYKMWEISVKVENFMPGYKQLEGKIST
jgi:hypothetical protein